MPVRPLILDDMKHENAQRWPCNTQFQACMNQLQFHKWWQEYVAFNQLMKRETHPNHSPWQCRSACSSLYIRTRPGHAILITLVFRHQIFMYYRSQQKMCTMRLHSPRTVSHRYTYTHRILYHHRAQSYYRLLSRQVSAY